MFATLDRIKRASPLRTWYALGRRRKVAIGAGAMLVALAGWLALVWWGEWPARLVLSGPGDVMPLDFTPDGQSLATTGPTGISLWETSTGRERDTWAQPKDHSVFKGRFTPDGRTLLAGWVVRGSGQPFSIDLIDVPSGRTRVTVPMIVGGYHDVVILPDGVTARALLTDSKAAAYIHDFDLNTGESRPSRKLSCPLPATRAVLSPDGRLVALNTSTSPTIAAPGAAIHLWDIEADREVTVLAGAASTPPSASIAFSPDGKTLAVGRDFGAVELWDLSTRTISRIWRDHSDSYSVRGLAFSGDGSTLVSPARYMGVGISIDRIRLEFARHHIPAGYKEGIETIVTDVESGRVRGRLRRREGRAMLAHDGRTLATYADDLTTKIRDVPR